MREREKETKMDDERGWRQRNNQFKMPSQIYFATHWH